MFMTNLLIEKTPAHWAKYIIAHFDEFLLDHAACEKKAAALAMSFIAKYPDRHEVINAMVNLSIEELKHFQEVFQIIQKKGLSLPNKDYKDIYVNQIIKENRHGRQERLLDRLITSSLIEARGCERFFLLAKQLNEPFFKNFYHRLATEESGHQQIFLRLAKQYFSDNLIDEAINRLSIIESQAMLASPVSHRLH
jgi:tRNA 2-(methylsulfanyl)-N6-isopentenyladenosine37 hydroxylase